MRQKICMTLAIVWMCVIFSFSARSAQESTIQSHTVGCLIGKMLIVDFETWPESEQTAFAEKWDYPVRKAAHMTEYAVLGVLLAGAFAAGGKVQYKKTAGKAFAVSMAYAVSDEIHQYFVPGRACRLYDVGFDSAGAFIGIVCAIWILALWEGRNV